MKRVLLALCLASIALAGCSSSPTWDKADIEKKAQLGFSEQQVEKGSKIVCTRVSLVEKSENEFTGYTEYSDGTRLAVSVTVDPHTGKFIASER